MSYQKELMFTTSHYTRWDRSLYAASFRDIRAETVQVKCMPMHGRFIMEA